MKLTYETGIATFAQMATIGLMNIPSSITAVAKSCHKDSSGCISEVITSLILYLLIIGWFGFIWALGYLAQDRRSKNMARLLIAAEFLVIVVSYFNLRHPPAGPAVYSRAIAIIDLIFAIWIILLAFRIMRAKGGRVVVGKHRARQRRRPAPKSS